MGISSMRTKPAAADFPQANFTISNGGKRGLESIRRVLAEHSPDDLPAIACVGWGYTHRNSDNKLLSENVVVTYYPQSQLQEVAHGIQTVSGIDLIFFTTHELRQKFSGKVLDFDDARGFFLRSP